MTVYVDDMLRQATVGGTSSRWSHLLADTHAELMVKALTVLSVAAADEPHDEGDDAGQDEQLDQEDEQLGGSDAADGHGVHAEEGTRDRLALEVANR